ncbi:hypothetical protein KLP28_08715 [Nocardioidaceae bacterium]|nr:hypothetical protein KLP28_08715 [Nocardioidaceae bacterium]
MTRARPTRPSAGCRRGEQGGFASLLLVGLCAVLVLATVVVGVLGGVLEASRRAAAAADLAALAAAQAVQQHQDACAAASTVAMAHDVRLVRCVVAGEVVSVATGADVAPVLGLSAWDEVVRAARAGP